MIPEITKPNKVAVPLEVGLKWWQDGFVYQQKLDGKFATHFGQLGVLVGENVGGKFTAVDCLECEGVDLRGQPLVARLEKRIRICRWERIPEVMTGLDGGKLLEHVLARGGEGIVRKHPQGNYWTPMEACKRLEAFQCVVGKFVGGSQSVEIVDAGTGQSRGKVALRGGKIDRVRVGSIIKVEGMGLTERGMIREPRPCKDSETSWLVKF